MGIAGLTRNVRPLRNTVNDWQLLIDPVDVGHVMSIPDNVLLEVFDFYVGEAEMIQAWQSLVHVCRQWRSVVFGSSKRLNLRLVCTSKTPARDTLDVWPPLPLLILGRARKGLDDIISVLEYSDRVHVIKLTHVSSSRLKQLSAAMQVPFPELTDLRLWSYRDVVLPDSFLGGSAPRLRFLSLDGVPFPRLPKLLLSATHLVDLHLERIPHSGYMSPEAMASVFPTLVRLRSLRLEFQFPRSRLDWTSRRPPPLTRSVLSNLLYFRFKGDSEYLDDLLARIDAPRLGDLYMIFFNQIVFDTPHLIQFICRTPRLKAFEKARVTFDGGAATVNLSSLTSGHGELQVYILCRELDWQVSSLEQVSTLSLPRLPALEDLYIHEGPSSRAHWKDNIENELWLELLHPFTTVKNLYLSEEFALRIGPALQELVGGRATEALPTLEKIFLEGLPPSGPVQEGIGKFVATREVTSHPIVVSRWDRGRN
jgi:hypothetical protein